MPPPLITAIKEKKVVEVNELVQNGSDLEVTDQKYQESALFAAIKCMNTDILTIILKRKHESGKRVVDINKKNARTGHTPLHWAIINRNFYAVESLLVCPDIKLNEKNFRGDTPLHMAVDKDFVKVVWALAVQPKINFDALNANKLKPEEVNSGGSSNTSHHARSLLKKCREYIQSHPDRKYLLVEEIEEIRYTMSHSDINVDLPRVQPVYQNNMYVNISNITAQNVMVAGGTINHNHGAVEITPPSSAVRGNAPNHVINEQTPREVPLSTRDAYQSTSQQNQSSHVINENYPRAAQSSACEQSREMHQSPPQQNRSSHVTNQYYPREQPRDMHQSPPQQNHSSHVTNQHGSRATQSSAREQSHDLPPPYHEVAINQPPQQDSAAGNNVASENFDNAPTRNVHDLMLDLNI